MDILYINKLEQMFLLFLFPYETYKT